MSHHKNEMHLDKYCTNMSNGGSSLLCLATCTFATWVIPPPSPELWGGSGQEQCPCPLLLGCLSPQPASQPAKPGCCLLGCSSSWPGSRCTLAAQGARQLEKQAPAMHSKQAVGAKPGAACSSGQKVVANNVLFWPCWGSCLTCAERAPQGGGAARHGARARSSPALARTRPRRA